MKNLSNNIIITALAVFASIYLVACGGGGGSGGISGTGITAGRITNFGSIIVNGVRFDVDSANFIRDGAPAAGQNEYSVGEFIVIKGNIDSSGVTGLAEEVTFTNEIEGAVTMASSDGSSLVVLGQKVITNTLTVLIGFNDISTLTIGNIVEVSGIKDANDDIYATSIKLKSTDFVLGTSENELKGVVADLNDAVKTFTISGIIIDYSEATFDDFGSQVLMDGLFVEVESDSMIIGNVLKADKIELKGKTELNEGSEAKIEGQITRFDSVTDFEVNGLKVTTDQDTEYSDGNIDDLILGASVELEGETNSTGVIVAKSIEFEDGEDELDEYEGFIESIDLSTNKVTVSGNTVIINSTTIMRDESDLDVSPFNLSDLAINDKVKIVGALQANGEILAIKFERKETEDQNEENSDENNQEDESEEDSEEDSEES